MKCPKCGNEARDVARFCQRCHATLRYECPACKHQQRQGGTCEKCGVDFLKYITAMMSAQKSEADADHERLEQRSRLMRNLLLTPFTLGIPLLRDLFAGSRKSRP
jgi:hypothetical protein